MTEFPRDPHPNRNRALMRPQGRFDGGLLLASLAKLVAAGDKSIPCWGERLAREDIEAGRERYSVFLALGQFPNFKNFVFPRGVVSGRCFECAKLPGRENNYRYRRKVSLDFVSRDTVLWIFQSRHRDRSPCAYGGTAESFHQ